MKPEEVSPEDSTRLYPAAKCRECDAVLAVCSLAEGIKLVEDAEHQVGCSKPPSRIVLLVLMRDQAPELMDTDFGRMLEKPLPTYMVKYADTMLRAYLERRR